MNLFLLHSNPKELALYDELGQNMDRGGTVRYQQNGKLHRDGDKPAVMCSDGTMKWYQNGKMHRDGDKPAAIYGTESNAPGAQEWFQHGQCHRENGPAIIDDNGGKHWFNNGKFVRSEFPPPYGDDDSNDSDDYDY